MKAHCKHAYVNLVRAHACSDGCFGHTGLNLCLLGLADDELVELLLVFGAEVLQALLGFGRDLELVHCDVVGVVDGLMW